MTKTRNQPSEVIIRLNTMDTFLGWKAYQYPNIAAGVIPKVAQSKRAIFSVGSALPET